MSFPGQGKGRQSHFSEVSLESERSLLNQVGTGLKDNDTSHRVDKGHCSRFQDQVTPLFSLHLLIQPLFTLINLNGFLSLAWKNVWKPASQVYYCKVELTSQPAASVCSIPGNDTSTDPVI